MCIYQQEPLARFVANQAWRQLAVKLQTKKTLKECRLRFLGFERLTAGHVTVCPKWMYVGMMLPIPPTVEAAEAATFCSCPSRCSQPRLRSAAASVGWPPLSVPGCTKASTAPSSSPD